MTSGISRLWADLRRRRVFQVAAIYAAVAWVVVQVAGEFAPALFLPDWVMTALVVGVIIGFPIAVILAWLFDVGPNGVVRTKPGSATGILSILVSIGLLAGGTAAFVAVVVPDHSGEGDATLSTILGPVENSIAVLPFLDLSPDGDSEYFSDGISDVLIHRLAQIKQLTVIARTSSFAFKEQDLDVIEIGKRLHVQRVLEGSVQRADGRLRIAAQLIDAETGAHVWSKLFDRDEKDIFEIQDEISFAVTDAMSLALTAEAREKLGSGITSDLDAYDLYLLGRHALMSAEANSSGDEPIAFFTRALEVDPDFPLALSGLADSYLFHGSNGFIPIDEAQQRAASAIDRALELDSQLGEAYASRVFYAAITSDYQLAEEAFERASELSPSHWPQYLWYGNVLIWQNRLTEAAEVFERALRLQPYRPEPLLKANLGGILVGLGEYERGMRMLVEVAEDQRGTHLERQYTAGLAGLAVENGRFDEGVALSKLAIDRGFDLNYVHAIAARAYLSMGDLSEAANEIETSNELNAKLAEAGEQDIYTELETMYLKGMMYALHGHDAELVKLRSTFAVGLTERFNPYGLYLAGLLAAFSDDYAEVYRNFEELIKSVRDVENLAFAALGSLRVGNTSAADRLLAEGHQDNERTISDGRGSAVRWFHSAELHAVKGDKDATIAMLERALQAGYCDHLFLSLLPMFDFVRDDPRFIRLTDEMRLRTDHMATRVNDARATGDWNTIIGHYFSDSPEADQN